MTQPTNRSEWLETRRAGLGCSDIAGILGLSSYASPWSVWQSKVDPPRESKQNILAEFGHRSEQLNSDWFSSKTGLATTDPGDCHMIWADDSPFPVFATIDRYVQAPPEASYTHDSVLELKACFGGANAKAWRDQLPMAAKAQLAMQLYCTGLSKGYFAALLFDGFGISHVYYTMDRTPKLEKFIQATVDKCQRFWEYVEKKIPPPSDFSKATTDAILRHYRLPPADFVELGYDFQIKHERMAKYKALRTKLDKKITGLTNEFRVKIGDHAEGRLFDGDGVYRRTKSKKDVISLRFGTLPKED